jgi:hypothetical protein
MDKVNCNVVLHMLQQLAYVGSLIEELILKEDPQLQHYNEASKFPVFISKIKTILANFFQDEKILDEFRVQVKY